MARIHIWLLITDMVQTCLQRWIAVARVRPISQRLLITLAQCVVVLGMCSHQLLLPFHGSPLVNSIRCQRLSLADKLQSTRQSVLPEQSNRHFLPGLATLSVEPVCNLDFSVIHVTR